MNSIRHNMAFERDAKSGAPLNFALGVIIRDATFAIAMQPRTTEGAHR